MDYTTLKNRVFENYYFNSYLPGTLGAYESSIIFNYFLTLESIQENLTQEMNISEVWIDDENNPTWYTSKLSDLFFVPRYSGETDIEYLERLTLLTGVSQDNNTIINAVYSVISKAVLNNSYIQIIDKLDGISVAWGNLANAIKWDGSAVWSSTFNVQRTLFLVNMSFIYRGAASDITTWDYWILPENYTKIEDIIKLYKPPGSTFEIRLNIPEDVETEIEVFSNTLIQWEGIHKVSDTQIATRDSRSITRSIDIPLRSRSVARDVIALQIRDSRSVTRSVVIPLESRSVTRIVEIPLVRDSRSVRRYVKI